MLRAGVVIEKVKGLTIFGNHSPTMFPDYSNTLISGKSAVKMVMKVGSKVNIYQP